MGGFENWRKNLQRTFKGIHAGVAANNSANLGSETVFGLEKRINSTHAQRYFSFALTLKSKNTGLKARSSTIVPGWMGNKGETA